MKCLSSVATLLATAAAAQASLLSGNPDLEIKASFGAANPYSQVFNGKTNPLNLVLINHSCVLSRRMQGMALTGGMLLGQKSSMSNTSLALSERLEARKSTLETSVYSLCCCAVLMRLDVQTTTAKYNINLPPSPNNAPVPLTYGFHSEAKPQDLNLVVWVDYALASDVRLLKRRQSEAD